MFFFLFFLQYSEVKKEKYTIKAALHKVDNIITVIITVKVVLNRHIFCLSACHAVQGFDFCSILL